MPALSSSHGKMVAAHIRRRGWPPGSPLRDVEGETGRLRRELDLVSFSKSYDVSRFEAVHLAGTVLHLKVSRDQHLVLFELVGVFERRPLLLLVETEGQRRRRVLRCREILE